ncbi:MAG TPA: hypothetical protein VHW95_16345 [Steroidobacteraceae bacterium]|jgi:hypothetical protein|nr:hypothetical protein [Steroidobacteraceae bacterium]
MLYPLGCRGYEAISLSRHGLDDSRARPLVAQSLPHFSDSRVQRRIDLDDDSLSPNGVNRFLMRDELPGPARQEYQQFQRLAIELYATAILAQLKIWRVEFKLTEINDGGAHAKGISISSLATSLRAIRADMEQKHFRNNLDFGQDSAVGAALGYIFIRNREIHVKVLRDAIFSAIGLGMTLSASVRAADNDHCSNATLHGDYAFTINGQIFPPGKPQITRDGVAMTHFDGDGMLSQNDFVMQYPDMLGMSSPVPNGDPPDAVTAFNVGETGKYRVFADCTGWLEIDFPPVGSGGAIIKGRFVLSDNGRAIHLIVYSAQPPLAPGPVPALIHSEGHKLKETQKF